MSLAEYAVYQATGITIPSGSQLNRVGEFIPPTGTIDLLLGDAVFWGGGSLAGYVHSDVYAGNGDVWDAIGVNVPVQIHTMTQLEAIYTYDGAVRYWSASTTATTG